jgi:glutathione S-transferase
MQVTLLISFHLQNKSEGSVMYNLYGFYTQNSMKPLYVLEEVGAPFEFHFVNLAKGEQKSESFKQKTPIGKAPVLEHGGASLFESGAICRYVANNEQSQLYPQDPLERARVDQWLDFFPCHLGRWFNTLYFERVLKPTLGIGDTNQDACDEAIKFATIQLGILDKHLREDNWLANDTLSIADLCAFAYIEQHQVVQFPLDDYSNVQKWFDGIEGRDSIARARGRLPS